MRALDEDTRVFSFFSTGPDSCFLEFQSLSVTLEIFDNVFLIFWESFICILFSSNEDDMVLRPNGDSPHVMFWPDWVCYYTAQKTKNTKIPQDTRSVSYIFINTIFYDYTLMKSPLISVNSNKYYFVYN